MAAKGEYQRPALDLGDKEMLCAFLDFHRDALLRNVEDLSEDLLRKRLVPSETTLLGLVKHLGWVEWSWFQLRFSGIEDLPRKAPADPSVGGSFVIEDDETTGEIISFYKEMCEQSRRVVRESSLEDLAANKDRGEIPLRWILLHMIEETARHNGHADILREQIDGATGE